MTNVVPFKHVTLLMDGDAASRQFANAIGAAVKKLVDELEARAETEPGAPRQTIVGTVRVSDRLAAALLEDGAVIIDARPADISDKED